jgi:parallel beta-helix repeat protein
MTQTPLQSAELVRAAQSRDALARLVARPLLWVGSFLIMSAYPGFGYPETILQSDDDASAINTVLSRGGKALLLNNAKPYVINSPLLFAAGAELVGQPGTIIRVAASIQFFRLPQTAHDVKIRDVTFDGSMLHVPRPAIACHAANLSWIGGGLSYGGPLFLLPGCDGTVIRGLKISFSSAGGIDIHGGNRTEVSDSEFENNLGFGILVTEGSSSFKLRANHSDRNGLEMIGVGYAAHDGEIVGNRISGSGDNCISVSGRNVSILDNDVSNCLAHGIAIYGDNNTVGNNRVTDNGQVNNPSAPPVQLWNGTKPIYKSPGYSLSSQWGIGIFGAFGGYGQNNHVEDNTIKDDQAQPTQGGIAIHTSTQPWTPGHVSAGTYVYANGSTYKATAAGDSLTMPSGSKEFREGELVWQWCSKPILATREATGNVISRNKVLGYRGVPVEDLTAGAGNVIRDNTVDRKAR